MRRIALVTAMLLGALPVQAQSTDRSGGKILWRAGSEYEQSLAEAREKGLAVLLFFKQDW